MHLLRHFLVALLLFLGSTPVFDGLDAALLDRQSLSVWKSLFVVLTWRSASFSSFISFSTAFVTASSLSLAARLAYDVKPAVGRKAFLFSCQFLPAPCQRERQSHVAQRSYVPFFLIPPVCGALATCLVGSATVDMVELTCAERAAVSINWRIHDRTRKSIDHVTVHVGLIDKIMSACHRLTCYGRKTIRHVKAKRSPCWSRIITA